MTTFYSRLPWTDHNGEHAANDPVELPNTTTEEQASVRTLIAHGVIGTEPLPVADKPAETTEVTGQDSTTKPAKR